MNRVKVKNHKEFQQELEKLRKEHLQLQSIIKAAPVGICVIIDRKIKFVNEQFCKMLGYSTEELVGQNSLIVYPSKKEYNRIGKYKYEEIKKKDIGSIETKFKQKDGSIIDGFLSLVPLNPDDLSLGIILTAFDISEQKQSKKKLLESEDRYISLFKNNHAVMLLIDPENADIVDANPAAVSFYGWSYEELTSKKITDINLLTKAEVYQEMELAKKEKRKHFYFQHRLSNGEICDVEVYSGPIIVKNKKFLYSIIHNISVQKKVEEKLIESEKKFRSVFEESAIAMALGNREGKYIKVNRAMTDIFGYSEEELLAMKTSDLTYPVDAIESTKLLEKLWLREINNISLEKRYLHKNGHIIWGRTTISPVKDANGKIKFHLSQMEDITKRKTAEEAAKKSKKLLNEIEKISRIGSWEVDITTGKSYLSDEVYDIYELPLGSEFSKEELFKFYEGKAKQKIKSAFKKLIDTGESYDLKLPFVTAKNNKLWLRTISKAEMKDGKVVRVFGNIMDITAQQESEQNIIKKSNDLELINSINNAANRGAGFSELVELLTKGVKRNFDCKGATVYLLNEEKDHLCLQNFNLGSALLKKIEEIIDRKLDVSTIKIPLKNRSIYTKIMQSGKPQLVTNSQMIQELMMEFTENEKLKKLVPVIFKLLKINSVINFPLISNGKAIGMMDISGEKLFNESDIKRLEIISHSFTTIIMHRKAEESLHKSETKFRLLADHTYDWEYMLSSEGKYIYISPSCERITGYKRENFISNPNLLYDMVPSEFREAVFKHYQEENNRDTPVYTMEFPIINKRGDEVWLEHNCSPVFDEKGNYLGRRGNNREITDRVKADRELEKQRKLFASIVNNIPVMITLYDSNTKMLHLNKEFEKKIGVSTEEAKDIDLMKLCYPDPEYRKEVSEFMSLANQEWKDFNVTTKDGSIIESTWTNVVLENGIKIGIGLDVRERKIYEKELKNHRDHLEELVKERTLELEEKNKNLEKFNELFIGREFRIKELKEKIEVLKKQNNVKI